MSSGKATTVSGGDTQDSPGEQQPWANPGQGPQEPQGQQGPQGAQGPQEPQDAVPWQQPGQPMQPPQPSPQWQQPYPQQPGQSLPQQQPGQPAPQSQQPYPQQPDQSAQQPFPQQPGQPYSPQPGQPYSQQPNQYQQPGYQYQQPGYPYPQVQGVAPLRSGSKVAIFAAIGVVVAVGVIAAVVLAVGSSHSSPVAAASVQAAPVSAGAAPETDASSAQASSGATSGGNPLAYEASGTAAVPNIAVPTFDAAAAEKDYTVTFKTNRGDIVIDMNGKAAPYTVYSFVYLAEKTYFNNTKCHRLTTSGIYVLQCGDPTGTGSGGPGYTIPDENLASLGTPNASGTVTYQPGVVAMANIGQAHTGGSQFFIVYKDSPLTPTYAPFGMVTQGLSIIQQVAAAGTNNANGTGDGAPNESVQIESVTVQ